MTDRNTMIYKKIPVRGWILIWSVMLLSSCRVYQQDILFKLDDNFTSKDLAVPLAHAERNYELKVNDYFQLHVYTNKGERIIDPNNALNQSSGGGSGSGNNAQNQLRMKYEYLIQVDSMARLPMIGKIKLAGFTINEASLILQQAYNDHYKDCYVKINMTNRRVIVLGANGGQVIPLANENMTLAEVLALYGGIEFGAKANNIKLIRGDLDNPQVYKIDLTTIAGMRSTVTNVYPGDIIYVQPWRRPWLQTLRDVSPVLSITTSVITFVLVIQNLKQ